MDEILNFKMQIAFTSPDLKVNKFTKQFRLQIVITATKLNQENNGWDT